MKHLLLRALILLIIIFYCSCDQNSIEGKPKQEIKKTKVELKKENTAPEKDISHDDEENNIKEKDSTDFQAKISFPLGHQFIK